MINELKLIDNIDILFENKVVLYGAGYQGHRILSNLKLAGISDVYLCDSNPKKWNELVMSAEELKVFDNKEDIVIIITTEHTPYIDQILGVIIDLGLRTQKIFTKLSLEISLSQNINDLRINKDFRELKMHIDKMQNLSVLYKIKNYSISVIKNSIESNMKTFIYQPGKVGSATISNSLLAINVPNTHIHRLNIYKPADDYERQCIKECVRSYVNILKKQEVIKIISLVREPISRDLSGLFYSLFSGVEDTLPSNHSFMEACIDRMKERFIDNYAYGYQFDWFDIELKTVFGVDIFDHPFDKEKGYSVIKQDNIEVLIMKLEKLNTLERVIVDFVGAPEFKLINENEGDNKPYKYLYKNVKVAITIPREIVSLYYDNNPRMDHFYTEEEKAAFLKKWEKNIDYVELSN